MIKDMVLVGAGGHSKVVIEIIKEDYPHFNVIGITDKDSSKEGSKIQNTPIVGTDDILEELYNKGITLAFITIGTVGNGWIRSLLYHQLQSIGFMLPNICHSRSIISPTVIMGDGNAIFAGVILNADVRIGNNCIINTGCIIEHDCIIGHHVHIAPGVKVAGGVIIEDYSMIGIGASIIQGVRIGQNVLVGAGSVVLHDIPANSVIAGVPAKIIKKLLENS